MGSIREDTISRYSVVSMPTREQLSRMYLEKFMSIRVIATLKNKDPSEIRNLLNKYNIPIRRSGYMFR